MIEGWYKICNKERNLIDWIYLKVEEGGFQLGHNILDQEGLHSAPGEDVLPGHQDHLGRPVCWMPVGQRRR